MIENCCLNFCFLEKQLKKAKLIGKNCLFSKQDLLVQIFTFLNIKINYNKSFEENLIIISKTINFNIFEIKNDNVF